VCARVGNKRSRGVVTIRVRTDAVQSLRHQRRDLHQSTYLVPLKRSGLIILSDIAIPVPLIQQDKLTRAFLISQQAIPYRTRV
jgi:hypothetical protein